MAARLHPAVAQVRRAVRRALADLPPGACLVVACSGGADSLALAAATAVEARRSGWRTGAVVVDHGLQPGSAEVACGAAATALDTGLDSVDVITVKVGTAGGPEAAARAARYAALEEVAAERDATVLLGHTRDDQAETVLLGLARGSGTRSLAGMAAVVGRLRRPLLDVPRETTRAACAAEGLPFWDDPHNDDLRFARVRVRHSALPALEEALGPGVREALARTAAAARLDSDLLEALTDPLVDRARMPDGGWRVDVLLGADPALRRRALLRAARAAGSPAGELFTVHVDALERLLTDWHGQGPVDVPGHVRGWRHGGVLHLAGSEAADAATTP